MNEMDRTRTIKERKEKKPNGPISNHVKCQILIFFYFLRSLNVAERPRLKIIFFSFKIKNFSYSSFFMQRLKRVVNRILNIKIASSTSQNCGISYFILDDIASLAGSADAQNVNPDILKEICNGLKDEKLLCILDLPIV